MKDTAESRDWAGPKGEADSSAHLSDVGKNAMMGDENQDSNSKIEKPQDITSISKASDIVNDAGEPYPAVKDLKTGQDMSFPEGKLEHVPLEQRSSWGIAERRAFINTWTDQGLDTPPGGWTAYEIHHIRPREYGGTNEFDNLTPVKTEIHRKVVSPWWAGWGSGE